MDKHTENEIYTVKELARKIREGRRVIEGKKDVTHTIPSKIMVIDGNVKLSEGANIGLFKSKSK